LLDSPANLPEADRSAVAAAYQVAVGICGESPGSVESSPSTVPQRAQVVIDAMLSPGGGSVCWEAQEISLASDAVIVAVAGEVVGGPSAEAVVVVGVLPHVHFVTASKTRNPYLGSTIEGRSLLMLAAFAREHGKPAPILVVRKQANKGPRHSLSPSKATKEFLVIRLDSCKLPGDDQVSHMLGWLELGRHWQVALLEPPAGGSAPVARARSYTCSAEVRLAVATLNTVTLTSKGVAGVVVAQFLSFGTGIAARAIVLQVSATAGADDRLAKLAAQLKKHHGGPEFYHFRDALAGAKRTRNHEGLCRLLFTAANLS
jgi:hypothetical protein